MNRLNAIRDELVTCRRSIDYTILNINDASTFAGPIPLSREKLESTRENLEDIFFVRLFAEFEGILRHYLRSRPNALMFDDNERNIDWLFSKTYPSTSIPEKIKQQFNDARHHRNQIAHKNENVGQIASFYKILETFSRLANRL